MRRNSLPFILAAMMMAITLQACMDDDSFTTSPSHLLLFSADTVSLDTTFANVPTTTRSFWAYNRSGDGIRCQQVRLANGNQSGFRVNVNGTYLGASSGYQTQQVEIRDNDSIRVFVELTAPTTGQDQPRLVSDDLVFTLESGVEQRVNLRAYAWDATMTHSPVIAESTTLTGEKPIVVYGMMTVNEGVTLTLAAGTTLYFHQDAGIDVRGTLHALGQPGQEVTLRGDRLDRMFDYLPYDFTPGLWQGIHFHTSSYDNVMEYTDLHSAYNGIVCDSADVARQKLSLRQTTIHNCQGYGLHASNVLISMENCLVSNTLSGCAAFIGGHVSINHCTLAQFYPFDINRGEALYFSSDTYPLLDMQCRNSLITGYGEDMMTGLRGSDEHAFNYGFANCVIRTPEITGDEATHFVDIDYEDITDTTMYGQKHFVRIDTDSLRYDFRLSDASTAVGQANAATSLPIDRDGKPRDGNPDIGCYERQEPEEL